MLIMRMDNNLGGPESKKAKLATGSTGSVAAKKNSGRFQYCTFCYKNYVQKLIQQINNIYGTCKRLAQNVVKEINTNYVYVEVLY